MNEINQKKSNKNTSEMFLTNRCEWSCGYLARTSV